MQFKEELIKVVINLIEELFECKLNFVMQEVIYYSSQVNDKLNRMH